MYAASELKKKNKVLKKKVVQKQKANTPLMKKKEKEHDKIFQHEDKRNLSISDKNSMNAAEFKYVLNFKKAYKSISKELQKANKTLKKVKNKESAKNTSLCLLSSGVKLMELLKDISKVNSKISNEDKSMFIIGNFTSGYKNLISMVSSINTKNASKNSLASISKHYGDELKGNINQLRDNDFGLINPKIYGFEQDFTEKKDIIEKILMKYEDLSKNIIKTIEFSETSSENKMPIMGSKGE